MQIVDQRSGAILETASVGTRFFAEGIALVPGTVGGGGKDVLMLTWREGVFFVYDGKTLKKKETRTFTTNTGEGWGVAAMQDDLDKGVEKGKEPEEADHTTTNELQSAAEDKARDAEGVFGTSQRPDSEVVEPHAAHRPTPPPHPPPPSSSSSSSSSPGLFVSDGSSWLYEWDPQTFVERRRIQVKSSSGVPVRHLNELEYYKGDVLANVWYKDEIVRIDVKTGVVKVVYDFKELWPMDERTNVKPKSREREVDCFNGIAVLEDGEILVTGKLWPKFYRLKLDD